MSSDQEKAVKNSGEGAGPATLKPEVAGFAQMLHALGQTRQMSTEELLPLVYGELRWLANHKIAQEGNGLLLGATELVHEAWLRLGGLRQQNWESPTQFIAVAAQAMRWILVEHIRRKQALKRGGDTAPEALLESSLALNAPPDEILAIDEALEKLGEQDPVAAQLVNLRYFVGMTMEEAAASLGISKRSAEKIWTYARVWLRRELRQQK